jgi:hypothetical protein
MSCRCFGVRSRLGRCMSLCEAKRNAFDAEDPHRLLGVTSRRHSHSATPKLNLLTRNESGISIPLKSPSDTLTGGKVNFKTSMVPDNFQPSHYARAAIRPAAATGGFGEERAVFVRRQASRSPPTLRCNTADRAGRI